MPENTNQRKNQVFECLSRAAHGIFRGLRSFCVLYGLLVVLISMYAVLANNAVSMRSGVLSLNSALLFLGLALGLLQVNWAWGIFIAAIPLLANLGGQLNAFLGLEILSYPSCGFDLVAGFFLGKSLTLLHKHQFKHQFKSNLSSPLGWLQEFYCFLESKMPWQVGLLLFFINVEVFIAIARNLYQSAASTSFRGIAFNLSHFRPMPWRTDFMPVADLVAYGMAAALFMICLSALRHREHRSEYVIRPLLISLVLTVLLAIIQSSTGVGLPTDMKFFRADSLGSAAVSFYPDIHSYAGFVLLGCVGLWAYFASKKATPEGRLILLVIVFSWLGLLLSKSRSSFVIALLALTLLGLSIAYKRLSPRVFWVRLGMGVAVISLGVPLLAYLFLPEYFQHTLELIARVFSKNENYLNSATQEFGGRPELFKAALYMFAAFPWMGIGQGEFYRQSSNEVFSHSFLLSAWGGENAHNYFLQTLTETGLIGIAIFLLVLLSPVFATSKRADLKIGYFALGSLFLGNIYSHAFLVRENLLLAALFLALLYSYVPSTIGGIFSDPHALKSKIKTLCLITLLGGVVASGVYEVYKSFGKEPYIFGSECFINRPITKDGWASGLFELHLPRGTSGVTLSLESSRPDISNRRPLGFSLDIVDKDIQAVASLRGFWTDTGTHELVLSRPLKQGAVLDGEDSLILRLSSCYIPRDLGVSLDDRWLGVRILSIAYH